MPGCTQTELSVKLHAYELGLLANEEREEFEQHLLECSYCFSLLEKHAAAFNLLKQDESLKQEFIAGEIEEADSENQPQLVSHSKGRGRAFFMAALAVAAVLLFVYMIDKEPETASLNSQTLRFNRLRSADKAVIDLKAGGQALFELPLVPTDNVDSVKVTLSKADGTLLKTDRLALKSTNQFITVIHSLDTFEAGLYLLELEAIGEANQDLNASFTFRAR